MAVQEFTRQQKGLKTRHFTRKGVGAADGISAKQARFVAEYKKDHNATHAAIRAGYSEKTAGQQGFNLTRMPMVAEAIRVSEARTLAKIEVSVEKIRTELARVAFEELTDDHPPGRHAVKVRALELLGKDAGMFIERIEVTPSNMSDAERLRRREALETAVRARMLAQGTTIQAPQTPQDRKVSAGPSQVPPPPPGIVPRPPQRVARPSAQGPASCQTVDALPVKTSQATLGSS